MRERTERSFPHHSDTSEKVRQGMIGKRGKRTCGVRMWRHEKHGDGGDGVADNAPRGAPPPPALLLLLHTQTSTRKGIK